VEQGGPPLPFPADANAQVDPVRRLAGEVLARRGAGQAVVWVIQQRDAGCPEFGGRPAQFGFARGADRRAWRSG
jgi:hypothetical protein